MNSMQTYDQPHGGMAMSPIQSGPQEVATAAAAAQAVAAVQARYALAVSRPRSMDQFRAQLLAECKRPGFAEVARYSKPIGGKSVEGPSIRFVEAALRAYTNVLRDSYVSYETAQMRVIKVTLTDLENNITHQTDITVAKTVERSRVRDGQRILGERINSYGKPVYTVEATDDEVNVKAAALLSKAIRELGLRILPGDIVDEGQAQCIRTREQGVRDDPAAARKAIVDAFVGLGIQPVDLERYLGHPVAQCSPKQVVSLREVYATIRDGETTWREVIEAATGDAESKGDGDDSKKPENDHKATGKAANIAAKVKRNGDS